MGCVEGVALVMLCSTILKKGVIMSSFKRLRHQKYVRRVAMAAVYGVIVVLYGACYCTCRVRLVGIHHLHLAQARKMPIFIAFWHGRFLSCSYGLFQLRVRAVSMASQRFIGEIIGRFVGRVFNVQVVQGSGRRGWVAALKTIQKILEDASKMVALTVDGPSGPACQAKPGAVRLAQQSGAVLLPMTATASRQWSLPSWDAMTLPMPFSTLYVVCGAPIEMTEAMAQNKTQHLHLTACLNALQDAADQQYGHALD